MKRVQTLFLGSFRLRAVSSKVKSLGKSSIKAVIFLLFIAVLSNSHAQVIKGYIPNYRTIAFMDGSIAWDKMTDYYYFGSKIANTSGDVTIEYQERFDHVKSKAVEYGKRVWLCVGGWGKSQNFSQVAANATARQNFADNLVTICQNNGLYGIDLDWEFPASSDKENFKFLLKTIRETFDANGGYKLSVAVGGEQGHADNWDSGSFQYMDYLNIMSYDDPGLTDGNHSSLSFMQASMDIYNAIGCPYEKMVGGLAFYSRCAGVKMYSELYVSHDSNAYYNDVVGGFCHNSRPTLEAKVDYVMGVKNGSGVLIWEVTQDRNDKWSLLNVVDAKMQDYLCPVEKPDLGDDMSICGTGSLTLNSGLSTGGGITFQWFRNDISQGAPSASANTKVISQAGAWKVEVSDGNCSWDDEVVVSGTLPSVELGGPFDLCSPATQTLDAGVSGSGINYVWKKDGNVLSGVNTQTYTVTRAGNYELTLTASGCSSVSDVATVTSSLPLVSNDTICANGPATLTATGVGPFTWWSAPSDGVQLATGNSYSPTGGNSTFYVQDGVSSSVTAGPTPVGVVADWGAVNNQHVNFNADANLTITSVELFAKEWQGTCGAVGSTASITVDLYKDGVNTGVSGTGAATCGSVSRVQLNIPVSTGDNYELRVRDLTQGQYHMNNQSGPFDVPGVISIWGNNGKSGLFFNFDILAGSGCDRAPSSVVVDPGYSSCVGTAPTAAFSAGSTNECEGQTIVFTDASTDGPTSWSWDFGTGASPSTASGKGPHSVTYSSSGSKSVSLTVSNSNGSDVETKSNYVTINATPSAAGGITGANSVCQGQTKTYSIAAVNGATSYTWTVPSGASITSGQGTKSVTVSFAGASSGNIRVRPKNACGNGTAKTKGVTVNNAEVVSAISGLKSVCVNESNVAYSISPVSGATSYNWTLPSGASIVSGTGTESITVDFGSTAGNISVAVVGGCSAGVSNSKSVGLTSGAGNAGVISGEAALCADASGETYSINSVSGASGYTWTVPSGASIVSGGGTNSITVDFGSSAGNISVTPISSCGNGASNSKSIVINDVPSAAGNITGVTTVCDDGVSEIYTIASVSGATNYRWAVPPGASIISGQGSTSVSVDFSGASSGGVSVIPENSCGFGASETKFVTVNSVETVSMITGLTSVCANETNVAYSISPVSGATGYNWTLPSGASIVSGTGTDNITIDFGSTAGNVSVVVAGGCSAGASNSKSVALTTDAGDAGVITGQAEVCAYVSGETYSITSVSGASGYSWTVPSGASIVSGDGTNSITVDFGSSAGGITVTPTSSCGNGASSSKSISVNDVPSAAGNIAGETTVCEGESETYTIVSVPGATDYTWTVPIGASITSGQGTTSITVDFTGASSGNVRVTPENSCGNGTAKTKAIIVNSLETVSNISGLSTVCSNETNVAYSISPVSGATGYNWTLPSGASIVSGTGTDNITIDFGSTAGNVSVVVAGGCSAGASNSKSVVLTTGAGDAGVITGQAEVCANASGETYSITSVSGASGYSWTVPSGASIVSGDGTNSITVDFGSSAGGITVTPTSSCGNGASSSKSISVNDVPSAAGNIAGETTVCEGEFETYTIVSVPGATDYTWTVPTGASITSGQGTTSITVDFSGASSGNVRVAPRNTCGNGTAKSIPVTVNSLPAAVGMVSGVSTVCEGVTESYSVASVLGTTNYSWTVPLGASIVSGQGTTSIAVDFTGATSGNISVTPENACGDGVSKTLSVTVNLCDVLTADFEADVMKPCVDEVVTFTSLSFGLKGGETILWNFGPGASPSSASGIGPHQVKYSTAGAKTIILTLSDGVTTDIETKSSYIDVQANPEVGVIQGPVSLACGETTAEFSVVENAGWKYIWQPVNDNASTVRVDFGVNAKGKYSVSVHAIEGRCQGEQKTKFIDICEDDPISSIEDDLKSSISVYPNPFLDQLTIENGGVDLDQILVIDLQGRVIDELNVEFDQTTIKPSWTAGVYFIKFISGKSSVVKRIVRR